MYLDVLYDLIWRERWRGTASTILLSIILNEIFDEYSKQRRGKRKQRSHTNLHLLRRVFKKRLTQLVSNIENIFLSPQQISFLKAEITKRINNGERFPYIVNYVLERLVNTKIRDDHDRRMAKKYIRSYIGDLYRRYLRNEIDLIRHRVFLAYSGGGPILSYTIDCRDCGVWSFLNTIKRVLSVTNSPFFEGTNDINIIASTESVVWIDAIHRIDARPDADTNQYLVISHKGAGLVTDHILLGFFYLAKLYTLANPRRAANEALSLYRSVSAYRGWTCLIKYRNKLMPLIVVKMHFPNPNDDKLLDIDSLMLLPHLFSNAALPEKILENVKCFSSARYKMLRYSGSLYSEDSGAGMLIPHVFAEPMQLSTKTIETLSNIVDALLSAQRPHRLASLAFEMASKEMNHVCRDARNIEELIDITLLCFLNKIRLIQKRRVRKMV